MSIEDNIIETAMKTFLDVLDYTMTATNTVYEYVVSIPMIQEAGFSLLMTYSSYVEYFKDIFREMYIEYPTVKYITDETAYAVKCAMSVYNKTSIEPKCSSWVSTSLMHCQNTPNDFQLIENYYELDPIVYNTERAVAKKYEEFCDVTINIFEEDHYELKELLVILNASGQYVTYFVSENKKDKQRYVSLPVEKSKVSFLSIEYTHPDMKHSIPVDIDNGYMLVNNVLFSPLFIRRLLDYQSTPFVFDMDYVLKIMDSDLNVIEVTSNKYIQLNDKGYTIMDRRQVTTTK